LELLAAYFGQRLSHSGTIQSRSNNSVNDLTAEE